MTEPLSLQNLRQGVVITLPAPADMDSPRIVTVASQTCDIVQDSKPNCLVAPVVQVTSNKYEEIIKGRNPLLVPLKKDDQKYLAANMGSAYSLPKDELSSGVISFFPTGNDYDESAMALRAKLARTLGRFPFPDEVHPVFSKLKDKIRSKSGKQGNLGQVLNLVDEIRISADQWADQGRNLTLYFIVPSEYLIPAEEADPLWRWENVKGWQKPGRPDNISLDEICNLILSNSDLTSLMNLWSVFGDVIYRDLIAPNLDGDVAAVFVEVLSDEDMTLRVYRTTESLDLEALSEPKLGG